MNKIVFVLSDLHSSPQYVAILKKIHKIDKIAKIYIWPHPNSSFVKEMDNAEIPYTLVDLSTKFKKFDFVFTLIVYLLKNRVSTIYASGQWAILIGIFSGWVTKRKNRIYTRHYPDYHHQKKLYHWVLIDKLVSKMSTKVIAVSENVRKILVEKEKVPTYKVKVIYNSINLESFFSIRSENNSNETFTIGLISRLVEMKGILYALKAFEKFLEIEPSAKLVVIGGKSAEAGKILKEIEKFSHSSVQVVEFTSDISSWYRKFNVFIHVPVDKNCEAFGLVYLEALAAGLPCIYTSSGIVSEIETLKEYCNIVPFRDSSAIFSELYKIFKKINITEKAPKTLFEQFSEENMSSQYEEILQPSDE